ncbi:hypothetical protein QU577_18850 [Priestia megaterium]|uniref:Lipoprotein n=1 Tax=Priestia megaterium (strain WSH-002) TaxID=1006007 RepID=A0A8D4BM89_PRIMW|nr:MULTISPECIES: hypothetical protein [Priestia]AEN88383.1 hypothetical protein BMWSH_1500 [Priestia megaterium WSH-002]MDN3363830.1 hypothetical protein [Priestia megaterium]TPF16726.1 hypothetical protein CBE78_10625 [Priestia megaterium]TPF24299.1 hypothetical protein CBE79_16005 [Priestia megaterium]WKU25259.1 hypothetical protein Q3A90_10490 [Priestia megaterium]
MKRNLLFLGFMSILLLVLSSCVSKEESVRFEGEGDQWKALYLLNKGENTQNGQGSIIYKGKDKEKLGKVSYVVEGETSKLSGTDDETEGKINLNGSCSGCSTQSSNAPFHVTIKWNGKEDKFDLTSK